jgi:hypothetical protein
MERLMRIVLMVCLAAMALGIAQTGFNTARYIVYTAYEPVVIERTVIRREPPPVEREAASLHATSTLERSSGRISPYEEAPALPEEPQGP